jgi:NADPH2:quinone reductase
MAKAIGARVITAAGKLKANIDRILPLGQAAAAHRLQEDSTLHQAGTLTGKIVLRIKS